MWTDKKRGIRFDSPKMLLFSIGKYDSALRKSFRQSDAQYNARNAKHLDILVRVYSYPHKVKRQFNLKNYGSSPTLVV